MDWKPIVCDIFIGDNVAIGSSDVTRKDHWIQMALFNGLSVYPKCPCEQNMSIYSLRASQKERTQTMVVFLEYS